MRSVLLLVSTATIAAGPLAAQTWLADYDEPESTYQTLFDLRAAQGYHPASVAARQTTAGNRFEVIWRKDPTVTWVAMHNRTEANYQTELTNLSQAGFRPLSVDSYGAYPNERYIAVFVKDNVVWSERHRLTGAQYQTEFNTHGSNGYRLFDVGSSGAGANTYYTGIWVKPQAAYAGAHGRSLASIQNTIATWKAQGGRVIAVATAGDATTPTVSAVWDFPRLTTTEYTAQTLTELRNTTAAMALAGLRPLAVAGYDTTAGPRYVSSWSPENSTNVWTETGTPVAGMASFDTAMRNYMQADGISQGALAVTRGGKLVLARGYTWAPGSMTPTDPQSLFRIASLSKSLTAVGVLRLVQGGRLKLDQKISTILNMSSWTDPRARDVTVRHLLQHWGGWDRGRSGDPMFMDQKISTALQRPLPTDPQMIVDYMRTQNLDTAPGTAYAYSNFGYCLLGRLIEAIDGSSYEDYLLREVLLPVGASSIRITDALRGQQIAGEVNHDDPQLGASVMGPSSPTPVELPYGTWNIRSMDAHGGLVANVIDYARFLVAFDNRNNSPLLSAAMIDEMWKRPPGDTSTNPVYYGMGWQVRELGGGAINTWHTGSLNGTFTIMVRRSDGLNWVAFFNKRTANSGNIDAMLHSGAAGVTAWPGHDLFAAYASVSAFYGGCVAATLNPYIRPAAGSIARIGFPFAFEIQPFGTSTTLNRPFLYIGVSNTSWGGATLPLQLAVIGMPLCTLNVSPDVLIPLSNGGGRAMVAGIVPNQATLIGRRLLMQGLVTEPTANALGAVTTPGAAVQFGVK